MSDNPLRVLVVDDNHDNADIIRQYLEATREYAVTVAYDGDEALRSFHYARPDLVLLDVMMPGRDGWEVCRMMKSESAHPGSTRVIMVTARQELADRRTALQTGADDFLEKPLDLSKLLAAVRRNAATLAAGPVGPASPASPASPATGT
ncbi:MAG TPA: response regulator [Gemmatimonadaceae bacterium]